jgi:hypothetical protein
MRGTQILVAASLLAGTASALAESASLTVPIVISSSGLAGSFYTSELSLTNRGATTATLTFTYTAAFGGGGGTATDTLAPGRQKTVPDAIAYLISIGLPIPGSGNRGGVLRVDYKGLSSADAAAVTARTTTAVPGGRAGLAYAAFANGLRGRAYLFGLRQNAADRSNVAVLNAGPAGSGDAVLRITVFSGDPAAPASKTLPDVTLAPGGFQQFTEILKDVGFDRGYVRVEPVSDSRAPYYAYATILDQITSDGSFVPPLIEDEVWAESGVTLPVAVETAAFETEVILTNVSSQAATVRLTCVADAIQAADSAAVVDVPLAAGEQKVIPGFVQYLRDRGVPGVPARGPTFAGAVYLSATGTDPVGVFLGGRTQTTGAGGRYGLFYTAVPNESTSLAGAWVYGLQQDGENRANLALVNTGTRDSSPLNLHVDLHDGQTGSIARSFDVSLGPKKWTQINTVLSPGIAKGYAHVTRTDGTNPFLAYGVIVDGGTPQTRSDDGAFVISQVEAPPASPELAAVRKVEAKMQELRAGGLRYLDLVKAVASYMATLPEYSVTGVDEPSITAYGIFASGRAHLGSDNRDEGPRPNTAALRQALATTSIPDSGWARLMHSFTGVSWPQDHIYDLAAILENPPGGYAIRPGKVGDARLSAMRRVQGDGFFYINTHGGRYLKTNDRSTPPFFSIQSSTLATDQNAAIPEIAADLAAGRLTYQTEDNFINGFDTRFGITGDFVKTYWQFAPNSVVFINACFSGDLTQPGSAQEFIDACWAKNAGVYFGWTERATPFCYDTVRYFTDRLVGANQFRKESPDQRAMPWELSYQDTQRAGLTHDPAFGADLKAFPKAGGDSIIADPSIQEVLANEWDEELVLRGWFGKKQFYNGTSARVFVGGKQLTIKSWKSDGTEIVCALPATGPGSNGDTYVEVPSELGRWRKSNVHQLTEWAIEFQYIWDNWGDIPGVKIDGGGILRYRGDVGSYRLKPHETPQQPLRQMWPTKDSSIRLTGSGSGPSGQCTATMSGSGRFAPETEGFNSLQLAQALKVDALTPHLGALGLGFGALAGFPFTLTLSGPNCTGTIQAPVTFGELGGQADFVLPAQGGGTTTLPLFAIPLTFDGDFRIPQTRFIARDAGGEIRIDWRAVDPVPPIRTDLAR